MYKVRQLILFGLMVSLGLTSCVKEADELASPPANCENATVGKIEQFHSQVSGDLKIGRSLSVDSVVWYTEADINYYYCAPHKEYNFVETDDFVFQVTYDANKMVIASDYNDLYDEMVDSLSAFWYSLTEDSMTMPVVDVSLLAMENNLATLKLSAAIGYGVGMYKPDDFGDTDYWYYGEQSGKCGPYSCCQGTDAAILIGNKIRSESALVQYVAYNTIHLEEDVDPTAYPVAPIPGNPVDNYCDSRMYRSIFYWGSPPPNYVQCDFCLDPDEMNFYTDGTEYVYDDKNPNQSVYDNIFIHLEGIVIPMMWDYPAWHIADFMYGKGYTTQVAAPILQFKK